MSRQQTIDVLAQDRMDAQRLLLILERKLGQDTRHAACEHGLARTRRANHKQAELPRRRERNAALGNLLPQHIGIIKFWLKRRLDTLGIQIMPSRLAHTAGELRQMLDKATVHTGKRYMLIRSSCNKGQAHITRQQLKRNLAFYGQHATIQPELTGNKAMV